MAEQQPTEQEQTAIRLVEELLAQTSTPTPEQGWTVLPYQDALLVCPVTRARGGSLYLVRRGAVRPVLSSRVQTEEEVYAALVAEQGS